MQPVSELSRVAEPMGRGIGQKALQDSDRRRYVRQAPRAGARVANWELPVVIRDGERLIPTTAVVRLHEQLLGQNPSSLSPESNEETPGARQHQSPTSSWPNNEPRGFSARTVAEAIDVACPELGVSKEDLTTRSVAQGCCTCSGLALGQRP